MMPYTPSGPVRSLLEPCQCRKLYPVSYHGRWKWFSLPPSRRLGGALQEYGAWEVHSKSGKPRFLLQVSRCPIALLRNTVQYVSYKGVIRTTMRGSKNKRPESYMACGNRKSNFLEINISLHCGGFEEGRLKYMGRRAMMQGKRRFHVNEGSRTLPHARQQPTAFLIWLLTPAFRSCVLHRLYNW